MGKPSYVIGSPVSGDDFWGREEEIQDIRNSLRQNSVLLTAPRRFGKTSVMYYLKDNPKYGWDYLYLDVEGGNTPEVLINGILDKLAGSRAKVWERIKGAANRLQDSINGINVGGAGASAGIELGDSSDENWQERGEKIFSLLDKVDPRTVIIVDELPLLVKGMYENENFNGTKDFLHWFRNIRQSRDGITWIIGGSIGLVNVLQYVGTNRKVISELEKKHIDAFSENEAREYIQALIENEEGISNIPHGTRDIFLETLGTPIPFFIQILVKETMRPIACKEKLCERIIRETYEREFLSPSGSNYLKYYDERIKEKFKSDQVDIVRDVLKHTARKEILTVRDAREIYKENKKTKVDEDELSSILFELVHDYYLCTGKDTRQWQFAAKPIRDWWLKNKCF